MSALPISYLLHDCSFVVSSTVIPYYFGYIGFPALTCTFYGELVSFFKKSGWEFVKCSRSLSFYFKLISNFESKVCLLVDSMLLDHVFLLIHSTNVFLMIGVFNLFAFNKVGFIASISYLFSFCVVCFLFFFPPLVLIINII